MAATGSKLSPLLSTHNLKLVCEKCCVKEKEITYKLKSVPHQCTHNVLLCRVKGGGTWRPVGRRPAVPKPKRYITCWYFEEGYGCKMHRNRCTFARSDEEAAVWTFERCQGLDNVSLRNLIAQHERGLNQPNNTKHLSDLLTILDLKAVCNLCSVKEAELTYTVQTVAHKCGRNLLLAKCLASAWWRPVSERPTGGNIGRNVLYKVCDHYVEGSGCPKHTPVCTYAKSFEEATVWNYFREKRINKAEFIRHVKELEPVSETPEHAAQTIVEQFSGEFIEVCKQCFLGTPQKLSTKGWNDSCATGHSWDPVLVHYLSESSRKQIYSQVRPLPHNCQFTYCRHVQHGKPCLHQAGTCQSAQSEVEMVVWKAEHSGLLIRPHLLQMTSRAQNEPGQVSVYCKVCLVGFSSPERFFKHCSSLEHAQLLSQDTTTTWTGRKPPHNHRADFTLCERPKTCEYGNNCPKAHSEEELQEWVMRAEEEREIRHNMKDQGLSSYNMRLLEEYKNSSNEVYIISEQVDDVSISCDQDLTVECKQMNRILKWNFQVETERQLVHVALLKQEPGASFTLGDISSEPCLYLPGENFLTDEMTYDVTVSFTTINPGLYEQWLVLDFNMRPVLLKKLRVTAGELPPDNAEEPSVNHGTTFQTAERWHRGNRVIIPCSPRTEEQEDLLREYKPPQMSFLYKSSRKSQTPLTKENYKEKMHQFLYNEELEEEQVVSRLNVCGSITTSEILFSPYSGLMVAPGGQLFCTVSVPYKLTIDSSEGWLLQRVIQSALIAPVNSNSKVYEARILQHKSSENQVFLELSKQCCSDLGLKKDVSYEMELQFQLDRYSFCTMHKAIDVLPDTSRVLPDLRNCVVPTSNITYEKLNAKQQSAVSFITGNTTVRKSVAPLLIYGPFGTGKTFTLATAARQLCKQPNNKVLICTHTNSSADLYVREHFHPFISSSKENTLRPIRIKANKQGLALAATDKTTLKYCFLSEDETYFLLPTKAALDRHNIVITTATMARFIQDLKLTEGYFTHILIDEASQMLECEALMALGLAGPNTRVVLAGDHMQMGPKLFSVADHDRSNFTLLTRLFHYYQGQKCDASQNSRVIFSENYRSTKEIVEFVSTHFYVGKNDVIRASGDIPGPENGHALKFYHVRGECCLETGSMSWYNCQEAAKVAEAVKHILDCWPTKWGSMDPSSICVLSEGYQVRQIRSVLGKIHLREVHVETLANVQGKQFRVVIMTAVQTRDSLQKSHLPGLELFNDARVINTAMTRAQSQVVVIGDAAALCCYGKCSGIWKSFINHCISNNNVAPQHFTRDFFEKDVTETMRFQKPEREDERNSLSDAILKELKEEYEQELTTEYCPVEDTLECAEFGHQETTASASIHADTNLFNIGKNEPELFKKGKLFKESFKRGYVIPFHNPTKRIPITSREEMGQAFAGDEVLVQAGRVIRVTKQSESARVLLCTLEEEDHSRRKSNPDTNFVGRFMIPLKKTEPRILILLLKKKRNFLPIREQSYGQWMIASHTHLDENVRQNNVFVVQVISWRDGHTFPLGYVIEILPIGQTLASGLNILNEEFKVPRNMYHADKGSWADEDQIHRKDIRDLITFTVDPPGSKDLDDAISVREMGDHYELGIHIADVASFVSPNSQLDMEAQERGATFYCGQEKTVHMFPLNLSTGRFSLLPGEIRRVISLMFKVEKKTNKIIGEPSFQLSLIKSNKQLTYDEAEYIITERYKQRPRFDTVEDCVTVAYHFAQSQRRVRLEQEWAYAQMDDDRLPGQRKAHLMIEELSVLFNRLAAETLISLDKTKYSTPLRCQAEPNPEKVIEFKEKCEELIPLSFHVRHKVDHDEKPQSLENFRILTKVWRDIQAAAIADDLDKMVDLVAADDIHPLLQPVIDQFRKCSSKSYVIRSNSCDEARVGHYSLNLESYTQASSPIRRYMDIILQRHLHSFICDKDVQYTRMQITDLCNQFDQNLKKAKEYEQKAEQMAYAVSTKKQSASKIGFVVRADPDGDSFAVSFPFNRNIFSMSLPIMYKDLQLEDQPLFGENTPSVTLKWSKRIYTASTVQIKQIHQELKMMPDSGSCVELPLTTWKAIIDAIDKEDLHQAKSLIMDARTKQLKRQQSSEVSQIQTGLCTSEELEVLKEQSNHYVDIHLQFQPGDTLQLQMSSEVNRGYQVPTVQLVQIKPKFEICVDHIHSPIVCFTKTADDPSRTQYSDTHEYVRIWKPICEMESAATAVSEGENIIIEDLVVNFIQQPGNILTGSFYLPVEWIENWAIECNLAKCLLCIRKRGLKLPPASEHSAIVDPKEFTWVAHGFTTTVVKKKNEDKGQKVEFCIKHLPMENIPTCVFQKDTCFTVEIIPKLLPDIRKEQAVINIPQACELVQAVALGKRIPREVSSRWCVVRNELPNQLPDLNLSQREAVDKALNSNFTLIQGPPGTGKTVVGVYIVMRYFEENRKDPRRNVDPMDKNKKEVILYCGPSNKSVDVVAEYLVKFKDLLRPLRVYSQQVEMLDYPYPDCTLQFSRRTLRQDRSKPELRSITLHHRMREKENPHSEEIKAFDHRIRLAIENKGQQLTRQEVKEYKKLLSKAREYELKRHDIILCTCAQSSTPSITLNVSARQILIDECAMATEPLSMIPLVCNKPEKIVLIGDHKQLRPIVRNERVKKLGMAMSLFERYMPHKNRAVMLNIQYRMHEDICKFPSNEFYEGKLQTGVSRPNSVLRVDEKVMPIVFGDIIGQTISLVVSTAKGNENSKANKEEQDAVIAIAEKLVRMGKIEEESIAILSPYNAQVSEIKNELKKKKIHKITVTTITKSQGSEWRYIIISTVCSLPPNEIESEPDRAWLSKHLGFVGDPNQTNVGITRAKEGLCIIGNQALLRCSQTWKHLLDYYTLKNAVTDAEKISVQCASALGQLV